MQWRCTCALLIISLGLTHAEQPSSVNALQATPIATDVVASYQDDCPGVSTSRKSVFPGMRGFRLRLLGEEQEEMLLAWSLGSRTDQTRGREAECGTGPKGVHLVAWKDGKWAPERILFEDTFVFLNDVQPLPGGTLGLLWSEIPWTTRRTTEKYQLYFMSLAGSLDRRISLLDDQALRSSTHHLSLLRHVPKLRVHSDDSVSVFWSDTRTCREDNQGAPLIDCYLRPAQRQYHLMSELLEPVEFPAEQRRERILEFEVAQGPSGQVFLTWGENDRVLVRRFAGGRWGKKEEVIGRRNNIRYLHEFAVAVEPDGTCHIVLLAYQSKVETMILHSSNRTGKWKTDQFALPSAFSLDGSGLSLLSERDTGALHLLFQPLVQDPNGEAARPLLYSRIREGSQPDFMTLSKDSWPLQIELVEDSKGAVHAAWVTRSGSRYDLNHALLVP